MRKMMLSLSGALALLVLPSMASAGLSPMSDVDLRAVSGQGYVIVAGSLGPLTVPALSERDVVVRGVDVSAAAAQFRSANPWVGSVESIAVGLANQLVVPLVETKLQQAGLGMLTPISITIEP